MGFGIANPKLKVKYGEGAKQILPVGKQYPQALKTACKAAESGNFAMALMECNNVKIKETEEFKVDVFATISGLVDDWTKKLKDITAQNRFEAYMRLREIIMQLKGSKFEQKALDGLKDADKDKAIKNELAAEKAYLMTKEIARKMSEKDRNAQLPAALSAIVAKYPGTYFGDQAKTEVIKPTK